uniref:Uncharacterized protein n=1 Tax=Tanacetum cinerariifolium TaxID=118510 RepID=A0A6L2LWD4_TANCI|nr:hypothetical protein [Tanacetum cinerariifolium]
MFDYDEMFTFESDASLPPSLIYDRYQSGDGYHAVLPPHRGTFMLPKPDLVFHDAPNVNETVHTAFTVKLSLTKPDKDLSHTHRPLAPIIEDWVSDSEDDSESEILQNAPSFVQPNEQVKTHRPFVKPVETSIPAVNPKRVITKPKSHENSRNRKAGFVFTAAALKPYVTRPRQAKIVVTKPHSPPRRHINRSPSPKASNFPSKVIAAKASMDNAVKAVQGKWEWKPICPILDHVSQNISASMTLKRFDYNDALRRSKSGTCPIFMTLKLSIKDRLPLVEIQRVIYDKKNNVLFTDNECVVLSHEFKLPDENQVLLRVPRENNMYNVDLKNIVPFGDCLFAKATLDESNLWHRRLSHINFKIMNNLVKGNLVRGLPSKVFENNHTCVSCKKGKQYRASCKTNPVSSVNQPLQRRSLVYLEPLNKMALRNKKRTIIEAARTMLADSLLPIPFWPDAVNTACYVQNRVLVTKPQNKTFYELLLGRTPSIGFMKPFGCPVTILNTLDPLGKFDRKVDEGFLVGYSVSSKAFRVFNSKTRIIQETLHINFPENKPNVAGSGPTRLFDIDTLTKTMNYQPVTAGNQSNPSACVQEQFDTEKAGEDNVQQYALFPIWSSGSNNPQNTDEDDAFEVKEPRFRGRKPESELHVSPSSSAQTKKHYEKTKKEAKGKSPVESSIRYRNLSAEFKDFSDNNINEINAAVSPVPAVGQIFTNNTNTFSAAGPSNTADSPTHGKSSYVDTSQYLDDQNIPKLEDITYSDDEEDVGAEVDFTNLETTITVSPIPTTRVHKDHLVTQIICDLSLATQTRSMTRVAKDQGGLSQLNNDDFHTCIFSCFLSQEEPKRIHQALKDPS